MTVPQTDTGGRPEYGQARGITSAKELGKLAPCLRWKGCLLPRGKTMRCGSQLRASYDCLPKTQVPAKSVS